MATVWLGACCLSLTFDDVSVENMNSQFYRFKDIGKPKVHALRDLIIDFTGAEIQIEVARYEGKKAYPGVVVSAVDSMDCRALIWKAHAGSSPSTLAVLDARMGAEQALFYSVHGIER